MSLLRLIVLAACFGSLTVHTVKAQMAVRAGHAAGKVRLGTSFDAVQKLLGEPSVSDAVMGGKLWATWYAAPNSGKATLLPLSARQVNVYFQRTLINGSPSGTARVRVVQVNSPYFHTAIGALRPQRANFADIRRAYPAVRNGNVTFKFATGTLDYYQDVAHGIGFVVRRASLRDRGVCQAIVVFPPGHPYSPYIHRP